MKSYSFSKVSAHGYLTEADYDNKSIITEDLKQIINVAIRPFEKPLSYFSERKLIGHHIPLYEENCDTGFKKILKAVNYLLHWDKREMRSIVCCDFGNYRSRTVVEAFHYAKMGFHFEDEYKGYTNHLIYSCSTGHLPPLAEVEYELKRLGEQYDSSTQVNLDRMKEAASEKCYNDFARKTEEYLRLINGLDIKSNEYENLSPIMACFKQVRIKKGYVLDGFQAGIPRFDSSMHLYIRREDSDKFIPSDQNDFPRQSSLLSFQGEKMESQEVIVPFNEEGIWEAVLIYIAPRLMPGYWHWIMARIRPVTSDSSLISKCKTILDYEKYTGSDIIQPKVFMQSDNRAVVRFAAWGWYGLRLWELDVYKDGESVRIEKADETPRTLIHYEPKSKL